MVNYTEDNIYFPLGSNSPHGPVTKVSTPAGSYDSLQCEAFVFNNVLYRRRGRLLFWLTDDERKIPVQVRFKLPFYIGTVTLELIKEGTL